MARVGVHIELANSTFRKRKYVNAIDDCADALVDKWVDQVKHGTAGKSISIFPYIWDWWIMNGVGHSFCCIIILMLTSQRRGKPPDDRGRKWKRRGESGGSECLISGSLYFVNEVGREGGLGEVLALACGRCWTQRLSGASKTSQAPVSSGSSPRPRKLGSTTGTPHVLFYRYRRAVQMSSLAISIAKIL